MNGSDPKRTVGKAAAGLILDGMKVGLGSGSTVFYFLESLGERCRSEKLAIQAISTSIRTTQLALQFGIPLADEFTLSELDIAVDGADEVDRQKRLIKGGGGCLLREKIVADMSKELVIIVDSTKLSATLHNYPLPIEIMRFCCLSITAHVEQLGVKAKRRLTADGSPFVTENGNWILDLYFNASEFDLDQLDEKLHSIPGVLETGLFLHRTGRLLVGYPNGHIETL